MLRSGFAGAAAITHSRRPDTMGTHKLDPSCSRAALRQAFASMQMLHGMTTLPKLLGGSNLGAAVRPLWVLPQATTSMSAVGARQRSPPDSATM